MNKTESLSLLNSSMKSKYYLIAIIVFVSLAQSQNNFNITQTPPGDISIKFIPNVIRIDNQEPVILTLSVSEKPTKITLEIDGIPSEMYDDGTNGDSTSVD